MNRYDVMFDAMDKVTDALPSDKVLRAAVCFALAVSEAMNQGFTKEQFLTSVTGLWDKQKERECANGD